MPSFTTIVGLVSGLRKWRASKVGSNKEERRSMKRHVQTSKSNLLDLEDTASLKSNESKAGIENRSEAEILADENRRLRYEVFSLRQKMAANIAKADRDNYKATVNDLKWRRRYLELKRINVQLRDEVSLSFDE